MPHSLTSLYDLEGKVAAVTGGTGILCGEMARALGALGVKVAVLGRNMEKAQAVVDDVAAAGGEAIPVQCDVTDRASVEQARDKIVQACGQVDILVNGAGGNTPKATSGRVHALEQVDPSFFDLDEEGFRFVYDLNFIGTLLPCQVFGKAMVDRQAGTIINISSMAGMLPLTKVGAYSSAKAAIENFTKWLAVHFAPAGVRVNAIAPGFFLTEQNRFLLTDKDTGKATARGQTILSQTPMGRYGEAAELVGALVWLAGPSAGFVTGITVPVDGGFSAFGGV